MRRHRLPLPFLLLPAVLSCLLASCATNSRRSATEPTPPRVSDCEQGTISQPVPPLPQVWAVAGALTKDARDWIARTLGIVAAERGVDAEEAACLQRHVEAGDIL